ncbi:hypothetical protein [Knoellia subterranea]|uniref:Uncharacterized protein n=1 Tax=Knoellia subterranea KCTC 19937 TaxID=1385521 RepID=A0A0A0JLM8_9MICO|nr:hypothetical protein [Knoellia subterranea]KGN37674.1 hypothetical protein N803_11495 [Knoellia subterranea KCTC 19937]
MTDKKVVRAESADKPEKGSDSGPDWAPSEGANAQATKFRIIAFVLWLLAIAAELYLIFGVLMSGRPVTTAVMVILIVGLVLIAALAIGGSMLWKKANRLDPARKSETVKFFVQNQLGAFMALLAFLPLIVVILLDKDMSKGQKALAGGVGIVLAVLATYMGADFNPPSVEQYTEEQNSVIDAVGQDHVFWTKQGEVFHICAEASDLQRESKDNTIYEGTVADAHAAGKERLTLKVDQELKQCGLEPANGASSEPTPEPSTS